MRLKDMTAVIELDCVSKQFRLRQNRPRSFQELFLNTLRLRGKAPAETMWSLRDVSFDVQPGAMVGIIGSNGAGKSTALKLVSRIIAPTKGQVHINGKVTGLLELGAGFHPDLSGRENIYLNGAMLGIKRTQIDRLLDDIISFAELEQFIDAPVKHYSSGMYMRLGFAIAVHSDADALLVDEVLAVGDQAFQSKCFQRITELRRQGTAILLVSHDAAVVRRMCDQAIWLNRGRVQSSGAADDVIVDYMRQVWQERNARLAEDEQDDERERKSSEQRWGSREAVIEDVVFMGPDGEERHVFCTGEPFVARIHYRASQQIERPTFGVAIYRDDGAHVNGPNSVSDGYHISAIEGAGEVDYTIEALPLTPGRYEFTAAIYDHSSTHPYDHRHRAFVFEVQPGAVGERGGVVHIPNMWEHRA
jgi:ABC-type polysaccharide/polyol phosphate transport system ATPase subunit